MPRRRGMADCLRGMRAIPSFNANYAVLVDAGRGFSSWLARLESWFLVLACWGGWYDVKSSNHDFNLIGGNLMAVSMHRGKYHVQVTLDEKDYQLLRWYAYELDVTVNELLRRVTLNAARDYKENG